MTKQFSMADCRCLIEALSPSRVFPSSCRQSKILGPLTLKVLIKALLFLILFVPVGNWQIGVAADAQNQVLSLDGTGSYVRLPDEIFSDLDTATIEAWVKWHSFQLYSQPIGFGSIHPDWKVMAINNKAVSSTLQFFIYQTTTKLQLIQVPDILALDHWFHIAAVTGTSGMKLYLNGVLVGQNDFTGSFSMLERNRDNQFGKRHWEKGGHFFGQLDEIRVWNVARTREQILSAMHQKLTGREPNLVGLWNFDAGDASDSSPSGYHGQLIGDACCVFAPTPSVGESVQPSVLSGTITDAARQPLINATVCMEFGGSSAHREVKTDATGKYEMVVLPPVPSVQRKWVMNLSATHGDLGDWRLGLRLLSGERQKIDFMLKRANSISGTLLAFDNTPHTVIVVQAVKISDATVITTLSSEEGKYRFTNLFPGAYRVRCHVRGGYVYYRQPAYSFKKKANEDQSEVSATTLKVTAETSLSNIDFRFAPFKKGQWQNYSRSDGLASNSIHSIFQDREGAMWFGTDKGVSRYDGKRFTTFITADVLDGKDANTIFGISQDREGAMWFGTAKGVSRYDGKRFTTFTTADGLANMYVTSIAQDREGTMWFGTAGGVTRYEMPGLGYDGAQFTTLTTTDGLADNYVLSIFRDQAGTMWVGTNGGGVSRYDGTGESGTDLFTTFTTADGLGSNRVLSISQDCEGSMWFATEGGVSRYDGGGEPGTDLFTTFTIADGLANNYVRYIYPDTAGMIWFATDTGLSRYNEGRFTTLTTADGLGSNHVLGLYSDREGRMWFATPAEVSRYDGGGEPGANLFTTFTATDGLADNTVLSIFGDREGTIWVGTGSGASRYDRIGFTPLTTGDELVDDYFFQHIKSIAQDREGTIWFGMWNGVSRYDGERFTTLTTADGLGHQTVLSIFEDREGTIWVGTYGGVSRFNGKRFTTLTTADGLVDNQIQSICQDREGRMWFATPAGVSRYDGGGEPGADLFTTFTTADGLVSNDVLSIYKDREGTMWFGTFQDGISRYNGRVWTSLDTRDFGTTNLKQNSVAQIHQDSEGTFWFATKGGVIRYTPSQSTPKIFLSKVTIDTEYTDLAHLPAITTGTRVTFEYNAIDLNTHSDKRQFRVRIQSENGETEYGPTVTKADTFDHTFKNEGRYTFFVVAIDRDLNFSEPASVTLTVAPPWYLNGWIAFPAGSAIVVLLIAALFFSWRYFAQRRDSARLREQMFVAEQQSRQKIEHQARQLEVARDAALAANQAKSTFLANMSHEIRTPLNVILGYTQLLQKESNLEVSQREKIQTIHRSGDHLLKMINEILDLSRIEAGRMELKPTDFDLGALIDELSAMFELSCSKKGLTWAVHRDGYQSTEWLFVNGDEGKLRQVLINLLGNAIKFTHSGNVSLTIRKAAEGSRFTFEVSDTGPGLSFEERETILQPFAQGASGTTADGTGLGLAIAKARIELMGGQLSLESEPGIGARFFFTVVLSPAISDTTTGLVDKHREVVHLANGYTVKVLIADDIKENREILAEILTSIGCSVLRAENGEQAVEMFRNHRPDIVFMDIRMPKAKEGLLAAKQIWAEFGSDAAKIVAFSASALLHEQQNYRNEGFDDAIPKPFEPKQIFDVLARLLGVEYEYEASIDGTATPQALPEIGLPADLLSALMQAASDWNITDLSECINEVSKLSDDAQPLVERLRELERQYDFDGVLDLLGELTHES